MRYKREYRNANKAAHNAANRAAYAKGGQAREKASAERRERRLAERARKAALRERDKAARKAAKAAMRPLREERARIASRVKRSRRRKRYRAGDLTAAQAQDLLRRQFHRCAYCGVQGLLHLDHKHPLKLGGLHTLANVQWLCAWHNMSKRVTPDAEYRKTHGIPTLTPWMGLGLILI